MVPAILSTVSNRKWTTTTTTKYLLHESDHDRVEGRAQDVSSSLGGQEDPDRALGV